MSGLGEQIAVLDGLGALDPNGGRPRINRQDGRIGQQKARVDQYGRLIMRNVLTRQNVIDASQGGNYSGGSSYAAGLPLMPSSAGLANLPGSLPHKYNVINPSAGSNYSGGSNYTGGIPLVSSNAGLASSLISGGYGKAGLGLASSLISGGYGRAGLGAPLIDGGYGRAGLGGTGSMADEDLASAAEAVATERQVTGQMAPGEHRPRINRQDGRIGQQKARVDQYGRLIMRNVLTRQNVIDASQGGNYSGGSSYAAGLPLMPSSVGLAGLGACAPCSSGSMNSDDMGAINAGMQQAAALKVAAKNKRAPLAYRVACAKKYQALLTELCALRVRYGLPTSDKCKARVLQNIGKEHTDRSWA